MMITVKEYAQHEGISVQAAHKRLKSQRLSRFVSVDDHGRKQINTAIFDELPEGARVSTESTEGLNLSTDISTESTTISTDRVDNKPLIKPSKRVSSPFSTDQVKRTVEGFNDQVERFKGVSTESTDDSTEGLNRTPPEQPANASEGARLIAAEDAILTVKLEYAERRVSDLEAQVALMRDQYGQQVSALTEQIRAQASQIEALNERLREAHILIQTAQNNKRRIPLLDSILNRFKRKGETENE